MLILYLIIEEKIDYFGGFLMKLSVLFKKAILLGILTISIPIQAIWIPQWLSNIFPTFKAKNIPYISAGTVLLAGATLAGYLYYQKYYAKAPLNSVNSHNNDIEQNSVRKQLPQILRENKDKEKEIENSSLFTPFDAWKKNCDELPDYELPIIPPKKENPEKGKEKETDAPKSEEFQETNYYDERNTETALSAQDLQTALKTYFESLNNDKLLKNHNNWVDNEFPEKLFESLHNDNPKIFDPFVQKLVVDVGSIVAFHGDIHGDIKSLNAFIERLQKNGYLENFTIVHPHFYMVFLGDYTDRGWYGAEVIYTILALKCANPARVFMVRGNHEDATQNNPLAVGEANANNFYSQLVHKFPDEADSLFTLIQKMYETLPLALYLGSGDEHHKDFILCCHGGVEIGFDPHALLNHETSHSYTKLGSLNRYNQLLKLSEHQTILDLFIQANPLIIKNYNDLQENIFGTNKLFAIPFWKEFQPKDIITYKISPMHKNQEVPLYIGFQWNDYEINPVHETQQTPWFVKQSQSRGWKIGKTFNQAVLALHSDEKNIIHGVFRAHQHAQSPDDPMMQRILNTDKKDHDLNKGVGKLWIESKANDEEKENSRDPYIIWENIVCTFNVSPQTPYQKAGFDFVHR
jgi:hypothetical protein